MACLQVLEKSVGPEHPHYALTLSNLAQLLAAKVGHSIIVELW